MHLVNRMLENSKMKNTFENYQKAVFLKIDMFLIITCGMYLYEKNKKNESSKYMGWMKHNSCHIFQKNFQEIKDPTHYTWDFCLR